MDTLFSRFVLGRVLRYQCPDRIPRTGERALSVNCYAVYIKNSEGSWALLVRSISDQGLSGQYWDGGSFSHEASIPFQYLNETSIEVTHFYKRYEFEYKSIAKVF